MTVRRLAAVSAIALSAALGLAGCQQGSGECSAGAAQRGATSISQGTVQVVGGSTIGLMQVTCADGGPVARLSVVDQASGAGREVELTGGSSLELADGSTYEVAAISSSGGGSIDLVTAP